MLHEFHVIYSVRYYLRWHIAAVGLGTHYLWIRGHYYIYNIHKVRGKAFPLQAYGAQRVLGG
jgi:hypothetical protein